jgi:hypothetical protein
VPRRSLEGTPGRCRRTSRLSKVGNTSLPRSALALPCAWVRHEAEVFNVPTVKSMLGRKRRKAMITLNCDTITEMARKAGPSLFKPPNPIPEGLAVAVALGYHIVDDGGGGQCLVDGRRAQKRDST